MLQIYLRLLRRLGEHRAGFLTGAFFMMVLALTTGLYAYLAGPVLEFLMSGGEKGVGDIGSVIPGIDLEHLDREQAMKMLPILLIGIAVIKGVSYLGQFYFMGMTGQRVIVDLRRRLYAHLLTLPPAWFDRHHSGDIAARFTNDIAKVEMAVTYALASMIRDSLQVVVLLVVAFMLDWRLSILSFGVLPGIAIPVVRFAKSLRAVTSGANIVVGKLGELLHEVLGGIRVVQAFTMEPYEVRRFDEANAEYLGLMRRSYFVRGASSPTMEVLAVAGFAAAIWYATGGISRGEINAAHFMSFFMTVALLYPAIKSLGRLGPFIVTGAASAERVFEILDTVSEIQSPGGDEEELVFEHALRFEQVSFSYQCSDGGQKVALSEIELELEKGSITALVGPSGGGKSTLASLVPRFYDPSAGRVCLDGKDLRTLSLSGLRKLVAIVSQDTVIFNDSVRANVSCGDASLSDEAIWEALERAQAGQFVRELGQGIETKLGERGVSLSGGQRQRIAIARAILKNAPILILDEATSSLDTESEAAVQAALNELMGGRTVLVIAHRLSTIREANSIVVVEHGRIVESGGHEALLNAGGLYRRLYDLQFREGVSSEPSAASASGHAVSERGRSPETA